MLTAHARTWIHSICAVLLAASPAWSHPGSGIVVDAQGRVIFVDTFRHRILRIDVSGIVSTLVQGEDGKKLSLPHHLVLDKEGNVYSAGDRVGDVWKITPDGTTTQVYPPDRWIGIGIVGWGGNPFTRDTDGNLYCVHYQQFKHSQILKIGVDGRVASLAGGDWGYADGKGSAAQFRDLHGAGFAWASDGALLVTDQRTSIRRIARDGTVTTLAGGPEEGFRDGNGKDARFKGASGLAVDPKGNVFVADSGNRRIRIITPDGTVTTLAGSGNQAGGNGPAAEASFEDPVGVAVSADGTVYVLDYRDTRVRVRKIAPGGTVSTIASVP